MDAVRDGRLWPRGRPLGTVGGVFLLAYVDFHRDGRRGVTGCTARSLRRVGADVVVLLHCPPAAGKRLRRDARYDNVVGGTIKTSGGDVDVTVLSNQTVDVRANAGGTLLRCDLVLDGRDTRVAAVAEPLRNAYRVLLRFEHDRPIVVVGPLAENLDDPETIEAFGAAGFIDTHPAKPGLDTPPTTRSYGIMVKGLRSYGDGYYTDPDGCGVHWARLGH